MFDPSGHQYPFANLMWLRQTRGGSVPREDQNRSSQLMKWLEDNKRLISKRHTMHPPRLCPLGRYGPDSIRKVHFIPGCAESFTRSARSQNNKPKTQRRHGLFGEKLGTSVTDFTVSSNPRTLESRPGLCEIREIESRV